MTPLNRSFDTHARLQPIALAIALLGMALAAVPAVAQEPAPSTQEPPPAKVDEPVTTLPTVSVKAKPESAAGPVPGYVAKRSATATKTDTPLIETPQSISVITANRIDAIGATTLREAMGYTPGVNISPWGSDPRYDNWIFLRGFDAYKPGFNLDGLPLRNNDTWGVFQTDNYGAERVEVLRGPASVLYGQGGPGGTVNVVSKRPSADAQREIRLQVSDPERRQVAGDFSGPLSEDGNVLYRLTGLLREGETNGGFTPDDRLYLAPALTWNISPDTTLTVLPHLLRFNTGTPSAVPEVGSLLPSPSGSIPRSIFTGEPGFDRFEQEQWALGYQLEHRLNDDWTLRQNLRYAHLDLDYRQVWPGGFVTGSTSVISRMVYTSREDVGSFTVDNQAQTRFNAGRSQHTLLLGLDHQRTSFDVVASFAAGAPTLDLFAPVYGTGSIPATTPFNDSEVVLKQTGLYVQDQIKFGNRWSATLGSRYDSASTDTVNRVNVGERTSQSDHELSSRVGLVYLHPSGWAPYAGYTESFSPSSSLDSDTGKPFKPETGRQYEVGVRYQPPNRSDSHTVALFDLRRRNYITSNAGVARQIGEVQVRGLELESNLRPLPQANVTASYTLTPRAIVTSSSNPAEVGKQLNPVPRHQAGLWGDYRFVGGIKAGLGLRYSGSHRGFGETALAPLPSYTLADVLVETDAGAWNLALNVRNLTDKVYLTSCSSRSCYFGDERRVTATATYRW